MGKVMAVKENQLLGAISIMVRAQLRAAAPLENQAIKDRIIKMLVPKRKWN